jgi:hypothetical protein
MQNPFGEKQVLGVVYNTSMNRPDAALALCALYGFEGRRESRLTSVCVVGGGLNTAIFCDIVGHIYMIGAPRNSNAVLPVGLAALDPFPPEPAMVSAAIERRNEKDEPQYARTIRRVSDTSLAEAALRDGVMFSPDSVMILSAPATYLARSLDLPGVKEIYTARVRRLMIVDSGAAQEDVPALRRVLEEWPTPIFFCGREVGEALPFPGVSIEAGFSWTPHHPAIDAYRAFQPMPYDAPSGDLAASHYAVHPDSGFFRLSEPGSISVSDAGRMQFSNRADGKVRSLIIEPTRKTEAIHAFVELVSARPVPPPVRTRRVPAAVAQQVHPAAAAEAPQAPEKKQE